MDQDKQSIVIVKGKEVLVKDVIVIDIQEDIQGVDVATFKYKGKFYQSRVYVK